MAEGSYEAACMRAELLGLEKPNESDFVKINQVEKEKIEAAQFEEISLQNDELNKTGGGVTELNTILSSTQKKINKLKGVCGSLGDMIKSKLSGSKGDLSYSTDPSYIPNQGEATTSSTSKGTNINDAVDNLETIERGTHKTEQVDSQVDKLDSLLDKTDRALLSMDSQNKQMKRFLK